MVEIELFLSSEKTTNLLEEEFKLPLAQHRGFDAEGAALEATPLRDQLIEHLQALLSRHFIRQVAAQQIKNAIGAELLQLLLHLLPLIRQLAKPLKQLKTFSEQPSSRLVTTAFLVLPGCVTASQCRQKGQIGFAITTERWSLGRLQGLAGQLEGLMGSVGLPQQDQARHFAGG